MNTIKTLFAVRKRITEIDLCGWLGQAAPGDVLEYHRGFLALDTFSRYGFADPERVELARMARRAWWAAERGLVHLVQRRHGIDDFSYLAVARVQPKTAAVSLSTLLLTEAA